MHAAKSNCVILAFYVFRYISCLKVGKKMKDPTSTKQLITQKVGNIFYTMTMSMEVEITE